LVVTLPGPFVIAAPAPMPAHSPAGGSTAHGRARDAASLPRNLPTPGPDQIDNADTMSEPLIIQTPPSPSVWMLHPPTDPWGDGYVAVMRVELHDSGLDACTEVDLSWPPDGTDQDLIIFLQSLVDDWRGWTGERKWRSMDAKMWIDAHHDGTGHVTLGATLHEDSSSPDAWSVRVTVTLEAGEQMSQLVADLRALFAR
jgi:hypothetical protein